MLRRSPPKKDASPRGLAKNNKVTPPEYLNRPLYTQFQLPKGPKRYPEVPNRVRIVKNLLEQSLNIVVGFEIFEIAQKTKKLPLQSN